MQCTCDKEKVIRLDMTVIYLMNMSLICPIYYYVYASVCETHSSRAEMEGGSALNSHTAGGTVGASNSATMERVFAGV